MLMLPLNALLAWWLWVHGRAWFWRFKGLCPGGCWQDAEFCMCRPDLDADGGVVKLDQRGDDDDDEPVSWTFTPWEELSDEERAEGSDEEAR